MCDAAKSVLDLLEYRQLPHEIRWNLIEFCVVEFKDASFPRLFDLGPQTQQQKCY